MAKMVQNSGLLGKLGNRLAKVHEEHKDDEVKYQSGGSLPPGIEFGVARLSMCKFDEFKQGDNKGEVYFMAMGVVVSPKQCLVQATPNAKPQAVTIEGLQTKIGPLPICDTKKKDGTEVSAEDNYLVVQNEIKKLLPKGSELPDFDQLESLAAALVEEGPHFKFRTWQGAATDTYPNPRVNEVWQGLTEFNPEDASDGVEDNTEEAEPEPEKPAPKTSTKAAVKGTKAKPAPAPVEEAELPDDEIPFEELLETIAKGTNKKGEVNEEASEAIDRLRAAATEQLGLNDEEIDAYDTWADLVLAIREGGTEEVEEEDLAALGLAADGGDDDAINRLTELATEAGLDPNNSETYPDWDTLARTLAGVGNPDLVEGEAEEAPWKPEAGEVYHYKPIDLKTKKPAAKSVECEVMSVDEEKQTVTLKNLDTGNIIKDALKKVVNVKWDDLIQE